MTDVAAAAGVSVATVSRALSGRGDLPAATRSRIQRVARELGYARSARIGRPSVADPRLIELVLGQFDDGWTEEVTAGVRQAAASAGFDLVLTQERADVEDDWPERVASRRSSGVVLGLIRPTQKHLERLAELAIPLVLLDPMSDPHGAIASIGTTDELGGGDAARHLLDEGFTQFVIVNGEPRFRFGRARERGFREAVVDRAGTDESVVTVRGDWQDGALTKQLRPHLRPGTGVFACNDAMAVGVYRAARQLGLRIPTDIAVVGFDDAPRSATMVPPLTTVRQPIREMGARAVEHLRQLRDGETQGAARMEMPTQLVIRRSTAPARRT